MSSESVGIANNDLTEVGCNVRHVEHAPHSKQASFHMSLLDILWLLCTAGSVFNSLLCEVTYVFHVTLARSRYAVTYTDCSPALWANRVNFTAAVHTAFREKGRSREGVQQDPCSTQSIQGCLPAMPWFRTSVCSNT